MTEPREPAGRGLAAKTACLVPVLVLVGLACGTGACDAGQPPGEPRATIHGETLLLELARTPSQQALGLGDRDSLGWGRGMLFLYDSPRFATFWMKGMRLTSTSSGSGRAASSGSRPSSRTHARRGASPSPSRPRS